MRSTTEQYTVVAPDADPGWAVDAGYRPDPRRTRTLLTGPRPVLVRCEPPAGAAHPDGDVDLADSLAVIAVYAWLGVRVFATRHPRSARQVLDMVASIRGDRPPATARRGLA
ncbi:hypothetical protein [Murinocardiopsis flavida]|uniref:hypothetical protein n=1 Tax=Murinocardiopsis flavida TaxID=645275 RepID=UPI001FE37713|nr:hypothetical protein [Murinocardiopsis flavida]